MNHLHFDRISKRAERHQQENISSATVTFLNRKQSE